MSDWISRLTTHPPPWLEDPEDSEGSDSPAILSNWTLSVKAQHSEAGNVVSHSIEVSGQSESGFGVSEGMLLGIGISFSFVTIVGCSVYLTRR